MKKILSIVGISVWLAACAGGQETESLHVLKLCDVHEARSGDTITCMANGVTEDSTCFIGDETVEPRFDEEGHLLITLPDLTCGSHCEDLRIYCQNGAEDEIHIVDDFRLIRDDVVEANPSVSNIPNNTGSGTPTGTQPGCLQSSDCGTGHNCVEGQCQVEAETGTEEQGEQEQIEPTGETGEAGQAEDQTGQTPPTGECQSDADCVAGQKCEGGSCVMVETETPPAQPPVETPAETGDLSVRFMTRESDPQVSFPSQVMDGADKVGLTRLHVKIENPGDLLELYFWGDFRGSQCRDLLVRPDGNPFQPGSRGNEDYSYEENASYLNGVACDPQVGNCVAGTLPIQFIIMTPNSGGGSSAMRAYPDNLNTSLLRAFVPPTISCRIDLMPMVASGETDKKFYLLIPKDTNYTVAAKRRDGTIQTDVLSLTAPKASLSDESVTIEGQKIKVSFAYDKAIIKPSVDGCEHFPGEGNDSYYPGSSHEEGLPRGQYTTYCKPKASQKLSIRVPGLSGTESIPFQINVGLAHIKQFTEGSLRKKDDNCISAADCEGDLPITWSVENVYSIKNEKTGTVVQAGLMPGIGKVELYYQKHNPGTGEVSWEKIGNLNEPSGTTNIRRDYEHTRWRLKATGPDVFERWSNVIKMDYESLFGVTPSSPACHSVRQDDHTIFSGQRYFFTITTQHIQRIEWSCNAYRTNWSRLSNRDRVDQSSNNLDSRYARNGRFTEDLYEAMDLNQGVVYLEEGNYESRVFTLAADSMSRRGNCGLIGFDYQDRPQTLDVFTPSACPGLDGIFWWWLERDGKLSPIMMTDD